jgi:hypothetical protein
MVKEDGKTEIRQCGEDKPLTVRPESEGYGGLPPSVFPPDFALA